MLTTNDPTIDILTFMSFHHTKYNILLHLMYANRGDRCENEDKYLYKYSVIQYKTATLTKHKKHADFYDF